MLVLFYIICSMDITKGFRYCFQFYLHKYWFKKLVITNSSISYFDSSVSEKEVVSSLSKTMSKALKNMRT